MNLEDEKTDFGKGKILHVDESGRKRPGDRRVFIGLYFNRAGCVDCLDAAWTSNFAMDSQFLE